MIVQIHWLPHVPWTKPVCATLSIATDKSLLDSICSGYTSDKSCQKLIKVGGFGVSKANGLWYVGDHLLILCTGNICENLFWLAHDCLGHFGVDKAPGLLLLAKHEEETLKDGYIPSCADCQCNKSQTSKPAGPLHPLLIPREAWWIVLLLTSLVLWQQIRGLIVSCLLLIDWT
jgi:hypothetical protein